MSDVAVQDVPERSRFEIRVDATPAGFAAYRLRQGVITFTHTQIDDTFEGQGLGSTLAREALDTARVRGLTVVPACPFIRAYVEKHPEYADLVPADRR